MPRISCAPTPPQPAPRQPPQAVVEPPLGTSLPGTGLGPLSEATRDRARARAPGWDVHALEAEWRGMWQRSGRPLLRSPDRAFLGWLDKRMV